MEKYIIKRGPFEATEIQEVISARDMQEATSYAKSRYLDFIPDNEDGDGEHHYMYTDQPDRTLEIVIYPS